MHNLKLLVAKTRAEEIERIARRHAERPSLPQGLRRRSLWQRLP